MVLLWFSYGFQWDAAFPNLPIGQWGGLKHLHLLFEPFPEDQVEKEEPLLGMMLVGQQKIVNTI